MSGLLAPILDSSIFRMASTGMGVLFLVITFAMVYWLYRDATKRSAGAIVWGAIALACAVIGIIAGFPFLEYGLALVGLLPFALLISLIVVYMIVRPAEFTVDAQERDLSMRLLDAELENKACPKCGTGIESDHLICPECLTELRVKCDYCGRPIKSAWNACPYCEAKRRTAMPRRGGRYAATSFADDIEF